MSGQDPATESEAPPPPPAATARKSRWRWPRRIIGVVVLLAGLLALSAVLLDTDGGRRFLADRIATYELKSGLKIRIGRIDGSIYGDAVLRDVALIDTQRVFFTAPEVKLDWRPFGWIANRLDIRELIIRRGHLRAVPELNPGDPDDPLLLGFDIRIDRLEARGLIIDEALTGTRRVADLTGAADIRSGRVMARIDARLQNGEDRLLMLVDSVPDANRLQLEADLNAPKGGVIAALAGLSDTLTARLDGRGTWQRWLGRFDAQLGGEALAAFNVTLRDGTGLLAGDVQVAPLAGGDWARRLGRAVGVRAEGTLAERVLDGELMLEAPALSATMQGALDLGGNRLEAVDLTARLRRPELLLGEGLEARNMLLTAELDGRFSDLSVDYALSADRIGSGKFRVEQPRLKGTGGWRDGVARIPLQLSARSWATGNDYGDRILNGLSAQGEIRIADGQLGGAPIRVESRGARALVQLSGDLARGRILANVDWGLDPLAIRNIGRAAARGDARLSFGGGDAWQVQGGFDGRLAEIENRSLQTLLGGPPRITGQFDYGAGRPFVLRDATLGSDNLALLGGGRIEPGGQIVGRASGRHRRYGPFDVSFDSASLDSRALVVLEDPLPALGVEDLRLALGVVEDGFSLGISGGSSLGPLAGNALIFAESEGRTRIDVQRFAISDTVLSGELIALADGISGRLAANGGGLQGTVVLAPRPAGQGVTANLTLANARFRGASEILVNQGALEIQALFAEGRNTVDATVRAQGISRGRLFLGRVAANADLVNGEGKVTASIAGRRGSKFEMQAEADVASDRIAIAAQGQYGRRRLRLVQPMVLTATGDGGWRIARSELRLARGRVALDGRFGGGLTELDVDMADVPLALADIVIADLGLGGQLSGTLTYRAAGAAPPTGKASLKVAGLTRAGLVLSSRPVDVSANIALSPDTLGLRGIIRDEGKIIGRMQARIGDMPAAFDTASRLRRGALAGQLRYSGPADALWRLTGVEAFDVTGQVGVTLDARGSLADPDVRGRLGTRSARLESALAGTVVENISASGRFEGARLVLTRFTGSSTNGGSISGSGTIDYGGLFAEPVSEGVTIDMKMRADNALLVNRDDFAATMTGPLTVTSDGRGGVLGGDVVLNSGKFVLGQAATAQQLPDIAVREVNRRADEAPARAPRRPWRYDVKARADNRIMVSGLGLDSEWSADLALTGTVDAPRLAGISRLVRGDYEFAGRRFELERGTITFRNNSPPDPTLDIEAAANLSGLNATINVRGSGLRPEISFASIPALPEDELLARLLFGTSITDISAPEAVQLASALASLRGGGGLDPINALRNAVGLDRLRIVGADAATGQETSIAAGKYITRNTYVEVVTDGRGYSATQIEFQITRWLSILSTISTVGRQSANVRISRDY